ncbi:hypothetical protein [Mesorhizobium sp. B2-1-2]|uniref:hypothetical protein n=1 Tax=Mesorhizobium sp. B2-1-2 TaxID=2589973 RepID=UPI00174644BB|nr:hypothetical protein [Mesorhizobium sp. B2-1-2]
MKIDEHTIRLSQAGVPYEEKEENVPLWRGMVPLVLVGWVLLCGVGYWLYRAYEALPA